jgi:hypothetical protein
MRYTFDYPLSRSFLAFAVVSPTTKAKLRAPFSSDISCSLRCNTAERRGVGWKGGVRVSYVSASLFDTDDANLNEVSAFQDNRNWFTKKVVEQSC